MLLCNPCIPLLRVNPDLGETKQPWPGLEWSLWECEGRARVLVEHSPPTLAVFALIQPLCVCRSSSQQSPCSPGQGSISLLSSFLRAMETHSFQFAATTIQELGLL